MKNRFNKLAIATMLTFSSQAFSAEPVKIENDILDAMGTWTNHIEKNKVATVRLAVSKTGIADSNMNVKSDGSVNFTRTVFSRSLPDGEYDGYREDQGQSGINTELRFCQIDINVSANGKVDYKNGYCTDWNIGENHNKFSDQKLIDSNMPKSNSYGGLYQTMQADASLSGQYDLHVTAQEKADNKPYAKYVGGFCPEAGKLGIALGKEGTINYIGCTPVGVNRLDIEFMSVTKDVVSTQISTILNVKGNYIHIEMPKNIPCSNIDKQGTKSACRGANDYEAKQLERYSESNSNGGLNRGEFYYRDSNPAPWKLNVN